MKTSRIILDTFYSLLFLTTSLVLIHTLLDFFTHKTPKSTEEIISCPCWSSF